MKQLFKNLVYKDKKIDVLVDKDIISKMATTISNSEADKIIDCQNKLLSLPFNDPHVHIDSTMTAGEPRFNKSGSLFEGIEIWRQRKKKLTQDDFAKRTDLLFTKYIKNGVQNVRAHIDITGESVEIIKWAVQQKKKWAEKINLQIVAFPQDGIFSSTNGQKHMQKAIDYGADVLGCIPHYEFSTSLGLKSINYVLDLAQHNNLLVDAHCDEIDDGNSKFLEHLAAETWVKKMQGQVTASHTTAFSRYNPAYVRKLWRVLQEAQLNFIANPLINVHLGGRFDNVTPGRGITMVKQMLANKINVAYGHDDVQDPWYPLGDANMLQVLFMGIHLNHLTGYQEIIKSWNLITTNSAKIMNLSQYKIKEGNLANFIVLEALNTFEAIRLISPVHLNVKKGKILFQKK